MVHHAGRRGDIRFLSREYHQALGALKTQGQGGTTVITLGGGSPQELSLAAEQAARALGKRLYRVDLGHEVSKYIGETEKNLDLVFREAPGGSTVLLVEDGDALFCGGRSGTGGTPERPAEGIGRAVERLGMYRGFIIALLQQPPPPSQPTRKWRHLHVSLSSA